MVPDQLQKIAGYDGVMMNLGLIMLLQTDSIWWNQ